MKKILFFILAVTVFSSPVFAEASARSQHTEVELISETETVQPGRDLDLALRMKMDPGWHTYWKNPGDSGIPTQIRWDLPAGFEAGEIRWRYPEKHDMPPLTVYGYDGEIFLLTRITVPAGLKAEESVSIKARADWLECEEVCIPGHADLDLSLPVIDSVPAIQKKWARAFAGARAALPVTLDSPAVSVKGNAEHFLLDLNFEAGAVPATLQSLYFYPDEDNLIDHAALQRSVKKGQHVELLVPRSNLLEGVPANLRGVLVNQSGWRGAGSEKALALEAAVEPVEGKLDSDFADNKLTGIAALFFAFIGGLILNLMPCVFPVLSLKITHFVEEASHHPGRVWRHGAVFTLGVLLSFWILGAVLVLLKAAGHQIGWGFQLQSPLFILVLIFIFWLLALNLFGVYEIGVSLTQIGGYTTHRHGLPGAFLSGILATVVATPCTAPFMGAALGFALTQPVSTALGVFTALGLGMAMPYLLLSFFPPLLNRLPQPGPWMIRLKQVMGVLLLATAGWLAWVLFLQTGVRTLTGTGAVALLFTAAAFFYGRCVQPGHMRGSPVLTAFILVLLLTGVICVMRLSSYENGTDLFKKHQLYDLDWQDFSPEFIAEARRQNKNVFLDFTAAWCLSCQVNERLVFGSAEVRQAVAALDIVLVKADWTHYNPEITQALAAFNRSSIPFYVLYPGGQEPVILPEILTPQIFLKTLREKFPDQKI